MSKKYFESFYKTNKSNILEKRYNYYYRITEQRPDMYRTRIRKNNANSILQRLARKLSYNYTLQELFNGWKYLIIRKVVKEIVVDFD